jgi:hypothetical protein
MNSKTRDFELKVYKTLNPMSHFYMGLTLDLSLSGNNTHCFKVLRILGPKIQEVRRQWRTLYYRSFIICALDLILL